MKSLYFIFPMLLIISCGPFATETELPDVSGRICINAYAKADSVWRVGITRGLHVQKQVDTFEEIADASVLVFEDGNLMASLRYSPPVRNNPGHYFSDRDIVTKPGKTYRIQVNASPYAMASAECRMPVPVPITSVEVIDRNIDRDNNIPVAVYFDDPPGEENFYELRVRKTETFNQPSRPPYVYHYEHPVFTQNPLFYQKIEGYDFIYGESKLPPVLFEDKLLDGQHIKIDCKVYYDNRSTSPGHTKVYEMVLRTVSREYYQYRLTQELVRSGGDNPFAEPVQVYSNVANGFGIFGAYSQSTMAFQ